MSRPVSILSRAAKLRTLRCGAAAASSHVRNVSQIPETRPSDLITLVETPSLRPQSSSNTRLKENEYASMYDLADEDLPREETGAEQIILGPVRVVLAQEGAMLFRAHKSAKSARTGAASGSGTSGESETTVQPLPSRDCAISYARMRDNCRCSSCVDPSTRQKLRTSGSAASVTLSKAAKGFDAGGTPGIHITWSDSHSSFYSGDHLREMTSFNTGVTNVSHNLRRMFWNRRTLMQSPNLRMTYDDVQSPEGLLKMLKQAQAYGLVVISGVPTERTSDKDCELRAFMGRIGEIRNTFYGETWDVKTVHNSKNVAYTAQDLGLHMDLLYFSSPPRWQALHCLKNRAEGGSSYFADAFFAGQHIQTSDPATSDALARYPLDFEYDNDGHYLRCRHFVLNNLDSLRSHVNWSPPFQAQTPRIPGRKSMRQGLKAEKELYDALAKFEASLSRDGVQYEFTMAEGDLVFFDNRRVLHARRAFHGGDRWLKGCYLDAEVVWDKLVTMQR